MKKIISLLVSAFFVLGLMSTNAMADAAKGQKYYLKYMKEGAGMKEQNLLHNIHKRNGKHFLMVRQRNLLQSIQKNIQG